jgi:hypothetical protein
MGGELAKKRRGPSPSEPWKANGHRFRDHIFTAMLFSDADRPPAGARQGQLLCDRVGQRLSLYNEGELLQVSRYN